jgi:hypothetical protein
MLAGAGGVNDGVPGFRAQIRCLDELLERMKNGIAGGGLRSSRELLNLERAWFA